MVVLCGVGGRVGVERVSVGILHARKIRRAQSDERASASAHGMSTTRRAGVLQCRLAGPRAATQAQRSVVVRQPSKHAKPPSGPLGEALLLFLRLSEEIHRRVVERACVENKTILLVLCVVKTAQGDEQEEDKVI